MTQKRKAELQRKLSVAPVPRPPDGLADRIKADIPKYLLDADRERQRFSRSIAFTVRVAASILLLIGGAFLMIAVLSRTGAMKEQPVPSAAAPAAAQAQVADQNRETDTFATQSQPSPARSNTRDYAFAQPRQEEKEAQKKNAGSLGSVTGAKLDSSVTNEVGGARREMKDEKRASADFVAAPAPPASPAVTPSVPASQPEPVAVADAGKDAERVRASEPPAYRDAPKSSARLMREEVAASISRSDQSKLFGISVDRAAFDRLKTAIELGAQPDPGAVDIEALVNYFAGPAPKTRVVDMEVEVTSAPVNSGTCCVLRVTIDTPASKSPFVAKDAVLEISFDGEAVREFSRAGGSESTKLIQPLLMPSTSVTALYNFQLQPQPSRRQLIATVTLRYRSLPQNKPRTLIEEVHLSDIKRTWSTGTRRHRLATLGAVWGESLRDSARAAEVAMKAEELSKQQPADERARELATAAGRLQEKTQERR